MKITFVLKSANLSGGIRVVSIYAERLQKLGHEVLVVSCPPARETLLQEVKSLLKGQCWIPRHQKRPSHFDNVNVPHRVIETDRPISDADLPNADVVVATW